MRPPQELGWRAAILNATARSAKAWQGRHLARHFPRRLPHFPWVGGLEVACGNAALPGASLADRVFPGLAVAGEVEVEVGVVVGLAGAEHGGKTAAGGMAHRVEEARIVGGIVLIAAHLDPAFADAESTDIDRIGEAV